MNHIIKPGVALLSLLAAMLFCGTLITSAQPPAPPAASKQHSIYLPVIARPRTGTTPPTPPPVEHAGFFALHEALTYNAATAVDGSGVHLAFYISDEGQDEPRGQPAYYAYCPGTVITCADGANWGGLVQFSSQVNEVQIVLTQDGRPRLLIRRNGNTSYEYEYWACEQQCTDAQRWAGLQVAQAAGVELHNADLPQHSFALDAQGRPRFIYSNGWGNGRPTAIYYASCDAADCTQPGGWQETPIWGPIEGKTVTSDYASLVFDGDMPRVLTRVNYSGLPVRVDYFACDLGCDNPTSWNATTLQHPADQQWATGISRWTQPAIRVSRSISRPRSISRWAGSSITAGATTIAASRARRSRSCRLPVERARTSIWPSIKAAAPTWSMTPGCAGRWPSCGATPAAPAPHSGGGASWRPARS